MFLYRVAQAFDKQQVPYALVGGYAVALHGAVRGTIDIDVVIQLSKKDFIRAERALISIGLTPRLPVTAEQIFDFREEYIKNRNLIAWNFFNPKKQIEVVDIIITENEKKLEKVEKITIDHHVIKIASIDDLIRMKTKSARPQDLADIDALIRAQGLASALNKLESR